MQTVPECGGRGHVICHVARSRRYSGGSNTLGVWEDSQWEGKDKARGRRGVVRVGGGLRGGHLTRGRA